MKKANIALDVHLLRNDIDLPMYIQVEDKKLIDKPYTVRLVDAGVIKSEDIDNGNAPIDKMILQFSNIDNSAGGADGLERRCDLYWNN